VVTIKSDVLIKRGEIKKKSVEVRFYLKISERDII
jgi:hypothetical protein